MQTTTIRRAAAADAEPLTALMHASSAYRGAYFSMIADYRVTADYIDRHRVFVATAPDGDGQGGRGEHVLGFYSLVLDPPELDLAFVADQAQGTGVGRLLITHMIDQARAADLTEVRVVSHPPAEAFYRRMGAHRVGTVAPTSPKVAWERPELRFAVA
ncbi:GNAT family N-acetyltransferase [Streptomyces sp. NPDC093707]|uniref:GNAT family N-acetyltransferase n=1 Tax=Streptomyces sp. NPDC093707 TaxID=3154984 RepID=UPI00344BC1FE